MRLSAFYIRLKEIEKENEAPNKSTKSRKGNLRRWDWIVQKNGYETFPRWEFTEFTDFPTFQSYKENLSHQF